MKGKMIVVEGLDCTGKTTIIQQIAKEITKTYGNQCLILSGTPKDVPKVYNCSNIQSVVLIDSFVNHMTELANSIRYLLELGVVVLVDRWHYSTTVYQNDPVYTKPKTDKIDKIVSPDIILYCKADYETRKQRVEQRNKLDWLDRYSIEYEGVLNNRYNNVLKNEPNVIVYDTSHFLDDSTPEAISNRDNIVSTLLSVLTQ